MYRALWDRRHEGASWTNVYERPMDASYPKMHGTSGLTPITTWTNWYISEWQFASESPKRAMANIYDIDIIWY